MKIQVEHGDFAEHEIILRCRELDEEMLAILSLLKEQSARLIAYLDGALHVLLPSAVCYAEAVEGKTFLYTLDAVLETAQSLSFLQAQYGDAGFIRISKSQLANLHHVARLKSLPNSRIELSLKNGERLIVSRHYIQSLKEKLGLLD